VCQCGSSPRTYCSDPSPGYRWLAGLPPIIIGETVPSGSVGSPAVAAIAATGSGSSAVGAAEAAVADVSIAATVTAVSALRSLLFTGVLCGLRGGRPPRARWAFAAIRAADQEVVDAMAAYGVSGALSARAHLPARVQDAPDLPEQ